MKLSIEDLGLYKSVKLYGRLDSQSAGPIYDTLVGLGSLGPGKVIVNMSSVTVATRAGCKGLIVAAKMLHARTGQKLSIYGASGQVGTVLDQSGYEHLMEVQRHAAVRPQLAAQKNAVG
ncbi:MAG: STAS domain-containing protein [Pseudomonadota bacterium]